MIELITAYLILSIIWIDSLQHLNEGRNTYVNMLFVNCFRQMIKSYSLYFYIVLIIIIGFFDKIGPFASLYTFSKLKSSIIIISRKFIYYLFIIQIVGALSKY